jgi:hypothetical protein
MGKLMPKTKEDTEFDRWWKDWVSRRSVSRVLVDPRIPGKKPGADVENAADASPHNLAPEPDTAPAITQRRNTEAAASAYM